MSVKAQLLRFLQQPEEFSKGASDPQIWMRGLEQFAEPSIQSNDDYALRPAQLAAWKGLAGARAGLVLGPPGTGKTHVLSWFILAYVRARKDAGLPCRVFVSGFTRNAIGNLLEAVVARKAAHWADGPEICYLGNSPAGGLAPGIRPFPRLDGKNAVAAVEALDSVEHVIAGGSIWSLYRLLNTNAAPGADGLTAEMFDLVCIDEASQMVLGHGLMAIAGLKSEGRVVVAGDDRQLPPVRATREVALGERQLGGSLYSFLKSGGIPEFALEETFRLNAPLAAFPERKFYPGKYRSIVETKDLQLVPNWQEGLEDWERVALDPQWPICVLLHDGPPSATTNPLESELAVRLCQRLVERMPGAKDADGKISEDFWVNRLAVVSPHRAQNASIRLALPQELRDGAFVETVDRIQGKERDAILLSYCVADAEFALAEGEFIFAPERLNVAITRGRSKLIVMISRRLLDAVPADQDLLDKAEILREFVFDCSRTGEFKFRTKDGHTSAVTVRVKGFSDDQALVDIKPAEALPQTNLEMTPALETILQAVRAASLASAYGEATLRDVKRTLARGDEVLADLAALHALGHLSLKQKISKASVPFWTAKPFDEPRHVFAVDYETVATRLEEVIAQTRKGSFAPYYVDVRDRFAWMSPTGEDLLDSIIQRLKSEQNVELGFANSKITLDWVGGADDEEVGNDEAPAPVELADSDFEVLNDLERIEEKKINFGIFEGWTSAAQLADQTGRRRDSVTTSVGKLASAGWLMLGEEGRIRSRMAELAREVRYVKQRFNREDADERPYLVRSLKVELRDRDKPDRSAVPIEPSFAALATKLQDENHAKALMGLSHALAVIWGEGATIAKFQHRAMEAISLAWRGQGNPTMVVAADTGSGKTEAAALPLIAGAAADHLAGIRGVRAILTYPRVRLAANQAQRLAWYLSKLGEVPEMPTLTLGLQVAQVPSSLTRLYEEDKKAGWTDLGQGRLTFPFFGCPSPSCGADLILGVSAGENGADRLECTKCDWSFKGWIGSKESIRETPPSLFLPTTDSLHQWLHDSRYAAVFGDVAGHPPPRALLADEIHLYSHIHGAQVGYALRRLAARAAVNSDTDLPVLAIGMSATLGDPAQAWGRLIGSSTIEVITAEADEKLKSPRGREYFYFVQPEVESRGKDIAGASTTIQSLMCLAHGMRRRTGSEGGFRSLIFLDSIDKVRRLHAAYGDAEEVKHLHRYRTKSYVDAATGAPRDGCCGEPAGCDAFRDGECWFFAANDAQQRRAKGRCKPGQILKVADRPIFSGTSGKVEAQIKESDIVFSTSSLEVGYDDPDITLVYQHYAPQNLASFIQRKGRGGRGADDRPITGVTLSIYSSRDSWWFRKPHEMIEPAGFDTPMNPDNHFVRRGQLLSATLDAFSREEAKMGRPIDPRSPSDQDFAAAEDFVQAVFGAEPWREFGDCVSLKDLWTLAMGRFAGAEITNLRNARDAIDWIPAPLFQTINLPQLSVGLTGMPAKKEDISLALGTAAPGNATRRFDQVCVFWRPPTNGPATWFAPTDYESGIYKEPFDGGGDEWLTHLPREARPLLSGLSGKLFRPRTISLEELGKAHGIGWAPQWVVEPDGKCQRSDQAATNSRSVQHDSRGSLRGFPVIKPTPELGKVIPLSGLEPWIAKAEWFGGDSIGGKLTGLALARVYWGADSEIKLKDPREEAVTYCQTFTAPGSKEPMLHGYHVQTEGVQFHLNTERINGFVAEEMHRLDGDEHTKRWHAGQMLRHLVESGAQALGINSYEARRGAELIVSAAGDGELRKRLTKLVRFWSPTELASLLEDTRSQILSQHPLLSFRRVNKLIDSLGSTSFHELLKRSVAAVSDPQAFAGYLRSALVHSLAIRLRQSFLQVGRGDDRQIVMHVRTPVQFGDTANDTITICEAGAFGDGTTRAFVDHVDQAIRHWFDGFISDCPNAREDHVVRRAMAMSDRHSTWRRLDPNDQDTLISIAKDLALRADATLPASLTRILFGTEAIGSERFDLYDLASSLTKIEATLTERLRREPNAWELTSAAVEAARADPSSISGRLLVAYAGMEDASLEDSLSPEARLADQIFRIHARLCVDGCQACIHHPSDLMSDGLVESSTSRRLLEKFMGWNAEG